MIGEGIRKRSVLLACLPLLALCACSEPVPERAAGPAERSPEADREAVEQAQVAVTNAGNEEDLDSVMTFFTGESVLMPSGGGTIRGREAIRDHFAGSFERADFRIGIEPSGIRVSGDLAFSTGRSGGTVVGGATGDTTSLFARYLMVLERNPEDPGRWTILRWMWEPIDPT